MKKYNRIHNPIVLHNKLGQAPRSRFAGNSFQTTISCIVTQHTNLPANANGRFFVAALLFISCSIFC